MCCNSSVHNKYSQTYAWSGASRDFTNCTRRNNGVSVDHSKAYGYEEGWNFPQLIVMPND